MKKFLVFILVSVGALSLNAADLIHYVLRDSVQNLIREQENFDLLTLAYDSTDSFARELEQIESKLILGATGEKLSSTVRLAASYCPAGDMLTNIDKRQFVADCKRYVKSKWVAVSILRNSIGAIGQNDDWRPLLFEAVSFYCTLSNDFLGSEKSSASQFFFQCVQKAKGLLAILASHLDLIGQKDAILAGSPPSALKFAFSPQLHDDYGYFNTPLLLLGKHLAGVFALDFLSKPIFSIAREVSKSEITKGAFNEIDDDVFAIAEIKKPKTVLKNDVDFDEESCAAIGRTVLSVILDFYRREPYVAHFDRLSSYNIYSGATLDSFLTQKAPAKNQGDNKVNRRAPDRKNVKKKGQKGKTFSQRKSDQKKKPGRKKKHDTKQAPADNTTVVGSVMSAELKAPTDVDNIETLCVSAFARCITSVSPSIAPRPQARRPTTLKWSSDTGSAQSTSKPSSFSFARYARVLQFEQTNFLSYQFDGQTFDDSELFMRMSLKTSAKISREISEFFMRSRDYKEERFHNLATFYVRIHVKKNDGTPANYVFIHNDTYLSGATVFETRGETDFARSYRYVGPYDLLTSEDKMRYFKSSSVKHMFLRNAILEKLRKYVDGPWYYNALDSEALAFIDLMENKLAQFVQQIEQESTIKGVVIGIKSLHASCYRCGNLMQGLQRAMHEHLKELATEQKFFVANNAQYLIIVDGDLAPAHPLTHFKAFNDEQPPRLTTDLVEHSHQFRLLIKK